MYANGSIARAGRNAGSRRLRSLLKVALPTLALLLGATVGHAGDACYQDQVGDILVVKKFRMPRPGGCEPVHGHEHKSWCVVYGMACGTSDGSFVRFKTHFNCLASLSGTRDFTLPRLSDSGSGTTCQADFYTGALSCMNFNVQRVDCPTPRIYE